MSQPRRREWRGGCISTSSASEARTVPLVGTSTGAKGHGRHVTRVARQPRPPPGALSREARSVFGYAARHGTGSSFSPRRRQHRAGRGGLTARAVAPGPDPCRWWATAESERPDRSTRGRGTELSRPAPAPFRSSAANPSALNAWITFRAYCGFAANIAAASVALRPCADASTIPARRKRTRSRAVLVILTSRCASSGVSSPRSLGLSRHAHHLRRTASSADRD